MSHNKRHRDTTDPSNNHSKMESFLSTMTFAGTGPNKPRGGCACDECGGAGGLLPQAIIAAIRKHKKLKAETGPLKRTQQRELVQRHPSTQVSVYRLTMPLDSEPLVEFGSTHRLVWVKHLAPTSRLYSIGKGIVGSQDEERRRNELKEWTQGQVFLVPSNGGKAVAWIHNKDSSSNEQKGEEEEKKEEAASTKEKEEEEKEKDISSLGSGHAVLYVCKIPKDSLNIEEPLEEWQDIVRATCKESLDNFKAQDEGFQYQPLSEEKANLLRIALSSL